MQVRVSDDTLKKLVDKGYTLNRIARIAGYNQRHTMKRLAHMDLVTSPCPKVSDEALIELADGTRTLREIVELSGGYYQAVRYRIRALGLKTKRGDPSITPESRKLNEKIARLISEGQSYREIGKMVGL